MAERRQGGGLAAAVTGLLFVAACGSTTQLPQAPSAPPLTAASVAVKQTGTASVSIVPGSITYAIDNSGSLVINVRLTSHARSAQTISIRASLYGPNGSLIGDASGGETGIASGATVPLELTGPKPSDEIVSATFEVTSLPLR